jgi:energy-coupling factor transporter transmembrane protein EcfT
MENNFLETLWLESQSSPSIILLIFAVAFAVFLIFVTCKIIKIKMKSFGVVMLLFLWTLIPIAIYGFIQAYNLDQQKIPYEEGINIVPYETTVSKVSLAKQINSEIRKGAYFYTDSRSEENGQLKANLLDSDFILLKDYLLIITGDSKKRQRCHVVPLDEIVWAGAFPSVDRSGEKSKNHTVYSVVVFTKNYIYLAQQGTWSKAKRIAPELLHVLFGDKKNELFKFLKKEFGQELNNYEISRELNLLHSNNIARYKQIIDSLMIINHGQVELEVETEESYVDDVTKEESEFTNDTTNDIASSEQIKETNKDIELTSTEEVKETYNVEDREYLGKEVYARINDIQDGQEFLELFWNYHKNSTLNNLISSTSFFVIFLFVFTLISLSRKDVSVKKISSIVLAWTMLASFFILIWYKSYDSWGDDEYNEGENVIPYYTVLSRQELAKIVNDEIKNKEYFYTDLDVFANNEQKSNLYESNFILLRDYLLVLDNKCHVIPIDEIAWIGPRKKTKVETRRHGSKTSEKTVTEYSLIVFTKEHAIETRMKTQGRLNNTINGLLKAIPENIQSRRKLLESSFVRNYSDYQISSELYYLCERDKTKYRTITKSLLSSESSENSDSSEL